MALTDKLTAIADAIRAKEGTTGSMTLAEMPEKIAAIQTGGGGETSQIDGLIDRTITEISSDSVTSIGEYAFYKCSGLTTAVFPAATRISSSAFQGRSSLTALILRSETMATLSSTNAFSSTPIASGTGYIYVPAALVDSYKTATNWSVYADQIRAIEDYPDITGGAA